MRKVTIIGIGSGDPDQVTVQAVEALNATDVFFLVTKTAEQQELVDLRSAILERHVDDASYRIVEVRDPPRRRGSSRAEQLEAVAEWRGRRAVQYERLIREELGEDERGAFLAWGDPSLYESTLSVVEGIAASGSVTFDYEVVPGISAIAALTARHRIPLNRVGGTVQIVTGRRLAEGLPPGADDVVVMLDAECSFRHVAAHEDVDIYWGAYLGTEDEILISGRLADVAGEIERVRAEARGRKGWIFDTYLLRRT